MNEEAEKPVEVKRTVPSPFRLGMRHLPGQAAAYLWTLTRRFLAICLALAVLSSVVLGLLAWRLSQGPLDVAWLARRLEAGLATEQGPRLSIGIAAVAWEGFRMGVDHPLDIRLTDIVAIDPAGDPLGAPVFSIPEASISLSLHALLLGRLEPRAIELRNAHLTAHRASDGTLSIDFGPLGGSTSIPAPAGGDSSTGLLNAVLTELARPTATDRIAFRDTRLSQLGRVLIRDAALTMIDSQLGATWRAPRVDIDLHRRPTGGVEGSADITLTIGAEQARLRLGLTLGEGAQSGEARVNLTPVAPATLAGFSPALAALTALDAPVTLDGTLDLGAALAIRSGALHASIGRGRLVLADPPIILRQGEVHIALTGDTFSLRALRLEVAAIEAGPSSVLAATGDLTPEAGLWRGRGHLTLDRVAFADLPTLWPPFLAKNARDWVTRNIPTGFGYGAQLDLAGTARADFSEVKITAIKGGLIGDDLSVHWLRPVPPLEKIKARLEITDPDVMEIHTSAGHQILDGPSGLTSQAGRVRITGLSQRDQIAHVDLDLAGPVAELIALLRHPRLRLLDRSPFELRDPTGRFSGHLAVTVPLERDVALEDIAIRAQARTEGLSLAGIVAGHNLEQGVLDLDTTSEAMKITGRATIAAIPAQFSVDLDFREGGPGQIQQRISATARADFLSLAAAAGLNATGLASGPATAQLAYSRRRDGGAEMRVTGDLRETELQFSPLVWQKPAGRPASMDAKLRIQRDRVMAIDELSLRGESLDLRGRMEQQDQRLSLLRLDRAVLGRTDVHGSIAFLANDRVVATLEGPTVDLAPRLTAPPAPAHANPPKESSWSVDANFATALLAHDVRATDFRFQGESDGVVVRKLRLDGQAGTGAFRMQIAQDGAIRRLSATAADAGTLLRGMDIARKLSGGSITVEASYDDRAADRPLTGTARIENFSVLNAPALTNLLQAMTLYGLVQLAQGPGLGITRVVAPFRLTDTALEFQDVRAFNPSLGMTIKGRIDRVNATCDLNGTIVPAYFFNALLGEMPLFGRLFAPEAGGGLFAANYSLLGPLADPQVTVNPLSALTPGFLRGLFGGL